MKGKTILMYLADGEPTGLLVAEIRNWTGKVLVAPRSQLDQLSKREEARRTGAGLPDSAWWARSSSVAIVTLPARGLSRYARDRRSASTKGAARVVVEQR